MFTLSDFVAGCQSINCRTCHLKIKLVRFDTPEEIKYFKE